ncbi:hypothetical protein FORC83_p038 (plasmid) [Campylobacter jejuni]|nr:hypothetical protein FORC83_p038 [Campylobacter jejuni]
MKKMKYTVVIGSLLSGLSNFSEDKFETTKAYEVIMEALEDKLSNEEMEVIKRFATYGLLFQAARKRG